MAKAPRPRVLRLHIPADALDHRTPRIGADVAFGPVVVRFSLAQRRNRMLALRPPSVDGAPAVNLPPALAAEVQAAVIAAARAKPAAWEALTARGEPPGMRGACA